MADGARVQQCNAYSFASQKLTELGNGLPDKEKGDMKNGRAGFHGEGRERSIKIESPFF